MAVYTRLDQQQLRRFARAFRLGRLRRARGVPAGTVNTLYDLRTDRGRFFLRILEDRTARAAHFEESLLAHLAAAGLPVPTMMATASGERVVRFSRRQHLSVFAYLPGRELAPAEVRATHAEQIGSFLADMHRALRTFRRRHANDFSPPRIRAKLRACRAASFPPAVQRTLARLEQELGDWPAALPAGVAHGDLFTDNARWTRGRLKGVLDFEMAADAPLVYDLAVALCEWAFVGARFHPGRARAVLRGYLRQRDLTRDERRALYRSCRYAATRFAVTRFFDFELHRQPEVHRLRKDYREYVARLEVLRGLGARGFAAEIVRPITGRW
jgi:homoserine kinase type II